MIPPSFIEDLLARTDIVDVVGRHVELKRGGANLMGLCPFHAEKSPSFSVSPSKQFYYCFGCGAGGNAIRFLTEHTGVSFVEAVRDLAQQAGLKVPEEEVSAEEEVRRDKLRERRLSLADVLARAAEHYRRQLKASPRAIDYLRGRGLSGEIAARFGLGYAPEGWRGLASVFPRYDDPLLEESGLVIVREDEGGDEADRKRYDRFRDRIMFPIRSVQGDVIGFGGRVLDQGEPKYLNSPETPVFSKGRELYGLFEARQALRQRGYVLVVEGYMDVVALAQSGFGNAVATLGTACTAEHVHKLFRFTDSVVFSFDGDAAGRRAAGRALEASLPHATDTRTARFLFLPPEHDPDSYVRELGAAAFEEQIAQAVPLSRQLLEHAAQDCDLETAEGRARLVAQARPLIEQLPAGVLRDQIVDALAERARVARPTLRLDAMARRHEAAAGAGQADGAAARVPRPGAGVRRPLAAAASSLDRAVAVLLQRADLWDRLAPDAHDLLSGQPAPHGPFFAWLDRVIHDEGPIGSSALLEAMSGEAAPPELRALAARVAGFHDVPAADTAADELAVIVDRMRLLAVQQELDQLIAAGALDAAARERLNALHGLQRDLKRRLSGPGAQPAVG